MTFSMTDWWDHSGILARSMFCPHMDAWRLPAVMLLAYDHIAERSELFATIAGIIAPTVVLALIRLGGLMIPNMPFSLQKT